MKNEFYDVAFRKKRYGSLEELQTDVNPWLKKYNQFRPHSGKYCYGKTPMQTLDGVVTKLMPIEKCIEYAQQQEKNRYFSHTG